MFFTDSAQLSELTGSGVGKDDVQLERHFAFNVSKHLFEPSNKFRLGGFLQLEPYDESDLVGYLNPLFVTGRAHLSAGSRNV